MQAFESWSPLSLAIRCTAMRILTEDRYPRVGPPAGRRRCCGTQTSTVSGPSWLALLSCLQPLTWRERLPHAESPLPRCPWGSKRGNATFSTYVFSCSVSSPVGQQISRSAASQSSSACPSPSVLPGRRVVPCHTVADQVFACWFDHVEIEAQLHQSRVSAAGGAGRIQA